MFHSPWNSWRRVDVLERRTKMDWAFKIKKLVDIDFPEAKKFIIVCDNLNSRSMKYLYSTFTKEDADRITKRIEFHKFRRQK
jgi:hypothetical protein